MIDIDTAASDEETAALPEGYFKTDTADRQNTYTRNAEVAESAIKILNTLCPEKKGLAGLFSQKRLLSPEEFYLDRERMERHLRLRLRSRSQNAK